MGIAEYDLASSDQKVIVMITDPGNDIEYHIIFNRAIGINAETGGNPGFGSYQKVRDKVLITERATHDDFLDVPSYLELDLSQGQSGTITTSYNDWGESL